jgi:phi13 family phage major tail protein
MALKLSHKVDSAVVSSDDQISEVIYGQGSDDVEIQNKNIPLEDQARLFGHQIVNGEMIRSKDDVAPEVAFAYRSRKSNGAYAYEKYLCGRFQDPDMEAESNGEKVSPKYKTTKGSFYPRKFDGNSSKRMESDSPSYNSANLTNYFTNVDGAAPAALTLSSSAPANNATAVAAGTKPALTFNNAIADYSGIMLMNVTDDTVLTFTAAPDVTSKVITITPTSNFTSTKKINIILSNVTDVYGQKLANQIISFTIA